MRQQRSAEAEAIRLEQAARDATNSATRARALAAELDARIIASRTAVAASRTKLDAMGVQRRQLDARLAKARQPVVRLVAALVALQRRPAALALVQPASLDTQAHARAAIRTIVPEIESRTAGLRAQMAILRRLQVAAARENVTLAQASAQLLTQQTALSRYAASRLRAASLAANQGLTAQDRALALADDAGATSACDR